jgi:hypothetical protein
MRQIDGGSFGNFSFEPAGLYYGRLNTTSKNRARGDEIQRRAERFRSRRRSSRTDRGALIAST